MISSDRCYYKDELVSADAALQIRDSSAGVSKGDFTCIECHEPVRVHAAGSGVNHPAHFEHYAINQLCSYSKGDSGVQKGKRLPEDESFDIDDPSAIEGYEKDRTILTRGRNPQLALQRKERDNFTCQACDSRIEVDGKFIIECHHLNPVAVAGVGEVSINDLVSLCPTCHRIAHTRKIPYAPYEIRQIRMNAKQ